MRIEDLKNRKIVIWGLGREGKAVATFIRQKLPEQSLTFVDEGNGGDVLFLSPQDRAIHDRAAITAALQDADVIIKSPGVSLYHDLLQGKKTTSLLNLWLAEPRTYKVVCVTGTKGKSTTSSLLAHTLNALGRQAAVMGNIGVPVTEAAAHDIDFAIVEVSSYQAANLSEDCDIGIVTSLYPEHLDWHRSLRAYYRDKLNLLNNSRIKIINAASVQVARAYDIDVADVVLFNDASGFHIQDGQIYNSAKPLGLPPNLYLSRTHNLVNVCAVLAVLWQLAIDPVDALRAMADFHGLPHRQQELGKKDGILFVDDSISTTPQSAIAAMEAYTGHPISILIGGHDRGIDYVPLVAYLQDKKINAVLCMGVSGKRIFEQLRMPNAFYCASFDEAVGLAQQKTPADGVVLLSPAAPSYGMFKDFEERGRAFAALVGLGDIMEAKV